MYLYCTFHLRFNNWDYFYCLGNFPVYESFIIDVSSLLLICGIINFSIIVIKKLLEALNKIVIFLIFYHSQ